jgi:peptidoglycan/LPS O-acetylase OafA/YrhL
MRLELVLLAVLAAASLFLGGPPLNLRQEDWFHYSALGHFYWFALGLGIAVLSVAYRRDALPKGLEIVATHPGACWAAAGAIYLITLIPYDAAPFIVGGFTNAQYVSLNLIQGVLAVLLFLPAVFANPNRGAPARVLGHPALMWIGLISYGLLLWNTTFAAILGYPEQGYGYWTVLIGGVLISVPMAIASYYVVERPLMKLKYRPLREVLQERRRRKAQPLPQAGGPG